MRTWSLIVYRMIPLSYRERVFKVTERHFSRTMDILVRRFRRGFVDRDGLEDPSYGIQTTF